MQITALNNAFLLALKNIMAVELGICWLFDTQEIIETYLV